VLGYLVLENGISIFGVLLVRHQPLVVELGVLLDLFAALFIMGLTIFHISREFDHVDADRLASLKD
jgi:hydrogenase-4 component E